MNEALEIGRDKRVFLLFLLSVVWRFPVGVKYRLKLLKLCRFLMNINKRDLWEQNGIETGIEFASIKVKFHFLTKKALG
jgi:hypothetical protein